MVIVVRRQFGLPAFLENLPVFSEKTGKPHHLQPYAASRSYCRLCGSPKGSTSGNWEKAPRSGAKVCRERSQPYPAGSAVRKAVTLVGERHPCRRDTPLASSDDRDWVTFSSLGFPTLVVGRWGYAITWRGCDSKKRFFWKRSAM